MKLEKNKIRLFRKGHCILQGHVKGLNLTDLNMIKGSSFTSLKKDCVSPNWAWWIMEAIKGESERYIWAAHQSILNKQLVQPADREYCSPLSRSFLLWWWKQQTNLPYCWETLQFIKLMLYALMPCWQVFWIESVFSYRPTYRERMYWCWGHEYSGSYDSYSFHGKWMNLHSMSIYQPQA